MNPLTATRTGRPPIRVVVAGRGAPARASLRATLGGAVDLVVVGESTDLARCLGLCAALVPDVVVLDLRGPGAPDADPGAARGLAALHPRVQVLVVATLPDGDHVRRSLDAGAVGYLLDDVDPHVLRDGVRAVARGESPLDPRAVRAMLRARPAARGADLTARERQVLALVTRGLANKQIARQLAITDGTVKAHIGSIFTRIGVTGRTSAALWAERNLPRQTVTA